MLFSFILNGRKKIRKYLGFVPCQITSEKGRSDWMACCCLSGEAFQCSLASPFPPTLLKTGMTQRMGDTWPGCSGSVSPQAYEMLCGEKRGKPPISYLRCCLTLCCWGTQSLPLDSHWQKIRHYFSQEAISLKCNICISVGPGRCPCIPLQSRLALYFCQMQIDVLLQPLQILTECFEI